MTATTPPDPDVIAPRPGEEVDAAAVARVLAGKMPGTEGTPEIWQFPGGHANLTYLIHYPAADYVLRRGPHGDVAAGAHDMGREYRVLSVLYRKFPLAPRAYVFCEDKGVIGASFFVMERRHGLVVRRDVPPEFGGGADPAQTRKLSEVLIDTLADFHAVDPTAAGLDGLGKPDGYLQRQVRGWSDRWNRAKTKELRSADEVVRWLADHQPPTPSATLVHNDWRLDNMAVARDDAGRCVAVYDWDMCTVGDPFTDVGTLLSSWYEPGESFDFLSPMPSREPGFLSRAEAIERYGRRSGRDVSVMPYYYVFGLFKMAGIVQQLYFRFKQGQTQDTRMAGGEMVAEGLVDLAHAHMTKHG